MKRKKGWIKEKEEQCGRLEFVKGAEKRNVKGYWWCWRWGEGWPFQNRTYQLGANPVHVVEGIRKCIDQRRKGLPRRGMTEPGEKRCSKRWMEERRNGRLSSKDGSTPPPPTRPPPPARLGPPRLQLSMSKILYVIAAIGTQPHAAGYGRGLNVQRKRWRGGARLCVWVYVCVQQMLAHWRNPTSLGRSGWEMMLKERKRKVRRRRGGTVPEERDGAREREICCKAAPLQVSKRHDGFRTCAFSPSALYSFKSSAFFLPYPYFWGMWRRPGCVAVKKCSHLCRCGAEEQT